MVNTLSGSVSAYRKETVKPRFICIDEVMALLDVTRDEAMDIAYLPDSRSIAIHTLILHNAFIHILLLLRQWCSVYQINSCCFAHVPPPSSLLYWHFSLLT